MRVPLLDLSGQYQAIADELRVRIDRVLASQRFILGEEGARFEKEVAQYLGIEHAVGVSSGTDALLATLMALEIGPGNAIITSAYSFFATASSVTRVGAMPRFVDIDPATYNLSPAALRAYIEKHCRKMEGQLVDASGQLISAIMPVHLFGLSCEMNEIRAIAREHDLLVIEDAAQAIGAEYKIDETTKKAGTIGDIGCFSFYPSKNLGAAGDAGLIVCHNDALAARLRSVRQHGMEPRYHHHLIGGNFRLDEIQAAILDLKLRYLDGWGAARRAAADFYRAEFTRLGLTNRITLPIEPFRDDGLANHHIYHQFVIRTAQRDKLREHLTKAEIGTEIYYPIGLHLQECFRYLDYEEGDLPETERATRESLALPIYPEISRDAQTYVVNAIAAFFDKTSELAGGRR